MVVSDDDNSLTWRNLVVQWHLDQSVPLECGCDDETADDKLCESSVRYADLHLPGPDGTTELDGPPDKWNHDMWVAAWGRNAPLVLSPNEFRLPKPPTGMSWLATRMLVRGQKAIELALMKIGEKQMATIAHARIAADEDIVVEKARRMMQQSLD